MPKPAQTMQAKSVAQRTTPMLSSKQRTKRKECTGRNENFQQKQLDVERQEGRPIKRVKSVHADLRHDSGEIYHDTTYDFQQQLPVDSLPTGYQLAYGQDQIFDEPTMQGAQLPQGAWFEDPDPKNSGIVYNEQIDGMMGQYPDQVMVPHHNQNYLTEPFQSTWPNHQYPLEPVASPLSPTSTAREGALYHQQPWMIQPEVSGENMSYGDIQADQTLEAESLEYTIAPSVQYDSQQSRMLQPASGVDNEHQGSPTYKNLRFHHDAHTKIDNSQSMGPQQTQQHPKGSPFRQVSAPAALSDDKYVPDVTPAPLQYTSSPEYIPDDVLNQGNVRDSDPGQIFDIKLASRLQDWLSQN